MSTGTGRVKKKGGGLVPEPPHSHRALFTWREGNLPGYGPNNRDIHDIVGSYHRLEQRHFVPNHGAAGQILSPEQLERCRRESGLADLIPALKQILHSGDHLQVATVHNRDGWILWRFGSRWALKNAATLSMVEGACWREDIVGANAAGIALITGRGLLCIAHEHYVASHHRFSCAATPLYDAGGRIIGVLNVTTPAKMIHINTLDLVEAWARLVKGLARQVHDDKIALLREPARQTLDRLDTPAVVTDGCGHVVESKKVSKVRTLVLPTMVDGRPFQCHRLGIMWTIDKFGNGWLWRPVDQGPLRVTRVELDVRQPTRWLLTIHWGDTSTQYDLTRKHVEILYLLAWWREGRSATQLIRDLYDDSNTTNRNNTTVTVRTHFTRIRKQLSVDLFDSDPYRFKEGIEMTLVKPVDLAELLPFSTAPAICDIREGRA